MPANPIDDCTTCDEARFETTQSLRARLQPGSSVTVRGRRWSLDATVIHPDCSELHLTDAADGSRRILLWPFDRPVSIDPRPRYRAVRLHTWAAALRRLTALALDPWTPRSRAIAADVVPFQLAPAMAMASRTCRLLLADEVGLGKTIQAGWIVGDAVARNPDAHVLLTVPAGLRQQWRTELSRRFSIEATIVDARWLRDAVADLPADISPWTPPGVYIGSLDFLKRADIADAVAAHVWDLLVVDEAHTATAPTDRHAAIERFAANARRVIAITATPCSGSPSGFASLAAAGATPASAPSIMFRRSRGDVGDTRQRRHRFARVRISRAETRLQRLLERYSRDVWNEAVDDPAAARLAVTILRKRALSSPAAAARSLRRRLDLVQGRAPLPRQLPLFNTGDSIDDDVPESALAAPGMADGAREHRCLAALIAAADAADGTDSKLRYLRRLIARLRNESIVVFTEYRDTLQQLAASLPPSLQLHGGLTVNERDAVQQRFNGEGGLLLATDAAAEGLNLHQRCRLVVNYELPWNPARLEQRIGRVDRIGQRRTVHALTLTARDTAEDLVIRNLTRRLSRIVAALGTDDRLGAFLDDARTAGIVIGGDPLDPAQEAEADELATVTRDDGDLQPAIEAAAQITARRVMAGPPEVRQPDVLVSSMRVRGGPLPPGYVLLVSATARASDGFVAGARGFLLHMAARPECPNSSGAHRRIAAELTRTIDPCGAVPEIRSWFTGVTRAHDASVSIRIARERELLERTGRRPEVQPGLFDRRAVADAERTAALEEERDEIHRRELVRLERSRHLSLTVLASAVLILWR